MRLPSGNLQWHRHGRSSALFVLFCYNTAVDKDCGISDAVFHAVRMAIDSTTDSIKNGNRVGNIVGGSRIRDTKVIVVRCNWLFDWISCATAMPPDPYEPMAPRAKELWRLDVEEKNYHENYKEARSNKRMSLFLGLCFLLLEYLCVQTEQDLINRGLNIHGQYSVSENGVS